MSAQFAMIRNHLGLKPGGDCGYTEMLTIELPQIVLLILQIETMNLRTSMLDRFSRLLPAAGTAGRRVFRHIVAECNGKTYVLVNTPTLSYESYT
jgi:hypothetical protein